MNKKLLSTFVLIFGLTLSSHTAFADSTLGSTEPNNTFEDATEIQRNNADHPDKEYKLYIGKMDTKNDVDIYKVYLTAGDNTLIVQPYYADLDVVIYNESKEYYNDETFNYNTRQLNLKDVPAGMYYIQITTGFQPDLSKTPSYRLVVGNPYYSWGSYTQKNLGSLSITPRIRTSNIVPFDLTNNTSIEKGAIVDSIRFGGRESGSVSGRVRSVKAFDNWKWFDGKEYWFEAENVSAPYLPVKLKQGWNYKHSASSFGYTQRYTLTPEIYFKYYYPQNMNR